MSEREKDYWLYMILLSLLLLLFIDGFWIIPIVIAYYAYKIVRIRRYLKDQYHK